MEKEQYIPLIAAVQKGDKKSQNILFSEIYNDVYYFALKTVKNPDLAADITQEALIEIFNNINQLREPAAFPAWCRKIAYYQCTRHFKKKKDVLLEEESEEGSLFDTIKEETTEFIPDEALDQSDFRKTILEFIDTLSEEQRSAVMMYYFDELSVGEIAKIQNVSDGTIKSRLNYARKAIKGRVDDYEKKNGIKLYAFPLFGFIKWLFTQEKESFVVPISAAESAATAVNASCGVAVSYAVTASTGLGAKIAAIPFLTKLFAGIVTVSLIAGIATAIVLNLPKEEKESVNAGANTSVTDAPTATPEFSATPTLDNIIVTPTLTPTPTSTPEPTLTSTPTPTLTSTPTPTPTSTSTPTPTRKPTPTPTPTSTRTPTPTRKPTPTPTPTSTNTPTPTRKPTPTPTPTSTPEPTPADPLETLFTDYMYFLFNSEPDIYNCDTQFLSTEEITPDMFLMQLYGGGTHLGIEIPAEKTINGTTILDKERIIYTVKVSDLDNFTNAIFGRTFDYTGASGGHPFMGDYYYDADSNSIIYDNYNEGAGGGGDWNEAQFKGYITDDNINYTITYEEISEDGTSRIGTITVELRDGNYIITSHTIN